MNSYWIGIMTQTGIYLLAVLGVCILTGFTGLFSFGHAGFMAIGGYVSAIAVKFGDLPLPVGLLLGTAAAALVGIAIGTPTLKLRGDYFLIATLGIGEAIRMILENWEFVGGAKGLTDVGSGISFPLVLCIDILVIFMLANFLRSKHGRIALSIRDEETAAELIGVNITWEKIKNFMISAFFCGMAGCMYACYYTFITPNTFSTTTSNNLLAAVVFGGMGSVTGPTIAAAILAMLPEMLRFVQKWRLVLYGAVMILVMLFRPEGLMGGREFSIKGIVRWCCKIAAKVNRRGGEVSK